MCSALSPELLNLCVPRLDLLSLISTQLRDSVILRKFRLCRFVDCARLPLETATAS